MAARRFSSPRYATLRAWFRTPPDLSRWRVGGFELLSLAQIAAALVLLVIWAQLARHPWQNDAYAYWNAWKGGLYDLPWLDHLAYNYSPAFAQAEWPWTLLPWSLAWPIEVGAQILALGLICGPLVALAIYCVPINPVAGYANPVAATIQNGNIEILLALAIVAAYRWPSAWALVIHTKITPGIGIFWYALRREWRRLALAIGATAVVAAVSFAVAPQLWFDWIALLRTAAGTDTLSKEPVLRLPLAIRLVPAVALVAWGALTDRYWVIPIGAMLALPAIQLGGFAVAVGAIPLLIARSPRMAPLVPAAIRRLWRFQVVPAVAAGATSGPVGP